MLPYNPAESIGSVRVVIVSKISVYDDDTPEAAKKLVLRAALELFRAIDIRAPDRAIGRRVIYTEQSTLFRRQAKTSSGYSERYRQRHTEDAQKIRVTEESDFVWLHARSLFWPGVDQRLYVANRQ